MCPPTLTAVNETCRAHAARETRAKCWTLSPHKAEEEDLGEAQFPWKMADVDCAFQGSSSCPTLYLITAHGDPYKTSCPIQISNNQSESGTGGFDSLNRLLGVNAHAFGVYTTLRPHCSHYYEYDESLTQIKAIVLLVRVPTNSRALVCVMRIQVSDLSCLAFVCCPRQEDLDEFRQACKANQYLLRTNPLGLLSIIYDLRTRSWETWITRIWVEVNQIENQTRSGGAMSEWLMTDGGLARTQEWSNDMDPSRMVFQTDMQLKDLGMAPLDELGCADKLLPHLYTTDTEISHGTNVMSFGLRYAGFCLEAVGAVDAARRSAGLPSQPPGARAMVEERIRFTQSRCYAVQDRFTEIRERHRSQINASFSLNAHRESKISLDVARLVASDSRTMKTIGVLTLVFLPATLVTALWQADIFHLDDDMNWKVYSLSTASVTAAVFLCWWFYMKFSRKALHRFETAHLPLERGMV